MAELCLVDSLYVRRSLKLTCLLGIVVGCVMLIQKQNPIFPYRQSINMTAKRDPRSPLLFLYWTAKFSTKDWGFGPQLSQCQRLKDKCVFSTNRSLYHKADVMLLHMRDPFTIPKYRPSYQKWVFGIMESPIYTYVKLRRVRHQFNITMTYKRDSSIPWLYGRCVPHSNNTIITKLLEEHRRTNFATGKKHLVAWFTSHCHPQSKREVYVKNLSQHLDVHVYGSCGGNYSCPKNIAKRCLQMVNSEYKFSLAFENSLCVDYITEKVWRLMQNKINVVPVVMGYAKYAEILPPHSFINVNDFASPKALADHLKRVAANDTLYNEYFRWRTTHDCAGNGPPMGCQVCDYMLKHVNEQQTVDVEQFWATKMNCITPKEFKARWQSNNHTKRRRVAEKQERGAGA